MESINFNKTRIVFYNDEEKNLPDYEFLKHSASVDSDGGCIKWVAPIMNGRLVIPVKDMLFHEYRDISRNALEEILYCGYETVYFPMAMKEGVTKILEGLYINDENCVNRALFLFEDRFESIARNTKRTARATKFLAWVTGILLALNITALVLVIVKFADIFY